MKMKCAKISKVTFWKVKLLMNIIWKIEVLYKNGYAIKSVVMKSVELHLNCAK